MTIREALHSKPNPWIYPLGILCMVDAIGTAVGIHLGLVQEANPILAWVVDHWGLTGFLLTKLVGMNLPCVAVLALGSQMTQNPILKRGPMLAFFIYLGILGSSIAVQYL